MGKIISFFGTDHKCGTSMIAQSVAEKMAADYRDLNIALIHAESGNGEDYFPVVTESLDSIRPYLEEKLFDAGSIVSCGKHSNMYFISGTRKTGTASVFHPDMGEYYVKKLSERFDIVICDAGCEIEYGLCLGALFSSDRVYLVCSQSEASLRRYEYEKSLIEHLNLKTDKIIVSKYSRKNPNSLDYMAERLGIDKARLIAVRYSGFGELAEHDRTTIAGFNDRQFIKDMSVIEEDIKEVCGYAGI